MNRYFTYDDESIDEMIYPLDENFFWSRRFEYIWALNKVKETDVVLDSCTGVYHPFKYTLVNKCKEVYALDVRDLSYENLNKVTQIQFKTELDKFLYDKVKFNQASIVDMPYEDEFFDVIFAISCLEHLEEDKIIKGLKEFKRTLKEDGKIYVTLDYPTITPTKFIELTREAGLVVDGKCDWKLDEDKCISSVYFGEPRLYCFSIVLRKPKPFGRPKKIKNK
jgi:ubiquinone/menaquinone biosynthesis C-methylase UbiE